jgi:hypothetical protein
MQSTAAASGTAMKAVAARSSSCQASSEGSPQARPAISVSSAPSTETGSPASALASRQAAFSGSTTTRRGGCAAKLARICTETAAATPPTPPWTKTWVGGAGRAVAASSAISR